MSRAIEPDRGVGVLEDRDIAARGAAGGRWERRSLTRGTGALTPRSGAWSAGVQRASETGFEPVPGRWSRRAKKPTNREKRRIAVTRAAAGVEPVATQRPLVPVPSGEGRLDAMLEYLHAFEEEQRSRRKLQNVRATLRRRVERGSGLEWHSLPG